MNLLVTGSSGLIGSELQKDRQDDRLDGHVGWRSEDFNDLLIEVLERRLGSVPEDVRETIKSPRDRIHMIRLFKKAFQATSMESFADSLKANQPPNEQI